MKSILSNLTKDELIYLLNNSKSLSELLRTVHLSRTGGNSKTLYKICKIHNLENELNELIVRGKKSTSENAIFKNSYIKQYGIENLFVENSLFDGGTIRNIILKNKLLEYKCHKCNNNGTWLDQKITLQLEHKNGVNNDHRLENLEFLCPNWHSQTKTYGGKNIKRNKSKHFLIKEIKDKIQSDLIDKQIESIINSSIDFSKFGWVCKAANILNKSPQKVNKWMKKYMFDFYYKNCFKKTKKLGVLTTTIVALLEDG